jgi:hypothetical protein
MRQEVVLRRWWPSSRRWGALALAFGASACGAETASDRDGPRLSLTAVPALASPWALPAGQDIGLQWRQPIGSERTIDITAWRRVTPVERDALSLIQDRQPHYGARVEMRIANARRSFSADLKAIGLQLDNGAKIMLRRKDGNPTLYYRQQF